MTNEQIKRKKESLELFRKCRDEYNKLIDNAEDYLLEVESGNRNHDLTEEEREKIIKLLNEFLRKVKYQRIP